MDDKDVPFGGMWKVFLILGAGMDRDGLPRGQDDAATTTTRYWHYFSTMVH